MGLEQGRKLFAIRALRQEPAPSVSGRISLRASLATSPPRCNTIPDSMTAAVADLFETFIDNSVKTRINQTGGMQRAQAQR
jgi:hypothetical protein